MQCMSNRSFGQRSIVEAKNCTGTGSGSTAETPIHPNRDAPSVDQRKKAVGSPKKKAIEEEVIVGERQNFHLSTMCETISYLMTPERQSESYDDSLPYYDESPIPSPVRSEEKPNVSLCINLVPNSAVKLSPQQNSTLSQTMEPETFQLDNLNSTDQGNMISEILWQGTPAPTPGGSPLQLSPFETIQPSDESNPHPEPITGVPAPIHARDTKNTGRYHFRASLNAIYKPEFNRVISRILEKFDLTPEIFGKFIKLLKKTKSVSFERLKRLWAGESLHVSKADFESPTDSEKMLEELQDWLSRCGKAYQVFLKAYLKRFAHQTAICADVKGEARETNLAVIQHLHRCLKKLEHLSHNVVLLSNNSE